MSESSILTDRLPVVTLQIVFVDPGSITQLYVALALSFLFFGILEHCRPYKSDQTQRVARLAEINLFGTLSFVLMLEIDLVSSLTKQPFLDQLSGA